MAHIHGLRFAYLVIWLYINGVPTLVASRRSITFIRCIGIYLNLVSSSSSLMLLFLLLYSLCSIIHHSSHIAHVEYHMTFVLPKLLCRTILFSCLRNLKNVTLDKFFNPFKLTIIEANNKYIIVTIH